MRALLFHGPRDLRFETVPDPTLLEPTDALVAVRVAGLCGSDLHPYRGREQGLDPGTVMGHELVGEVVALGKAIPPTSGLRVGTRVACPFTTSCGECFYCRRGLTARCDRGQLLGWVQEGRGLHGAQAELVRIPLAASTLVPVPEEVSPAAALLAGDVLATGSSLAEAGEVGPGTVAVVIGCGPVGLMAVAASARLGAERVFAIDPVPGRRELARRLGAEPLEIPEDGLPEALSAATDGRGVDSALEAAGSPEALRLAYRLLRPGGTLAVAAVHTEPRLALSPAELYDKNLTLRLGRCSARARMDDLLPLLVERGEELAAIVSHRLPLAEGPDAYRRFDRREAGWTKVLFEPGAS